MIKKWIDKGIQIIFFAIFYHVRAFGVCTFAYRKGPSPTANVQAFKIRGNSKRTSYYAIECTWFTWICTIFRILSALGYFYGSLMLWYTIDPFFNIITFLQSVLTVSGAIVMGVGLLRSRAIFVNIVNYFIQLFQRTQRLAPHKSVMGVQQFAFLLIIIICMTRDTVDLMVLLDYTDIRERAVAFAKLYLERSLIFTLHIGCIGYMSVGALYGFVNKYMREEFQPRARCLDNVLRRNHNIRSQRYQRKLIRLTRELNECSCIYNNIYRAATSFHHHIRFHIFFSLIFTFSYLTTIIYSVLYLYTFYHDIIWWALLGCFQIFIELLIMIAAANSAVQGGSSVNKLSLDTMYMAGNAEWNQSVEIFINRMNLFEFKPNLLGLFDISSNILLMFLSASVTYLTYILQNTMLSQQ